MWLRSIIGGMLLKKVLKTFLISLIVFIAVVLLISSYLRYSDYLYFGKALTFGKWISYKDSPLGISYSYPDGINWKVYDHGWTPIFSCPSTIHIIGDSNQAYALSICKNPEEKVIEELLNDKRYVHNTIVINNKQYVVLETEAERENGIKTGRYLFPVDKSYLFGIARPYGPETAVDLIYKRIIGSIHNL